MKEPAKPQNTHQAERKPPFFAREADSLKESASPEAPFFNAPVIQPKLKTGQPGDRYEQQADRMAERVIRHDAAHGNFDSGEETVQLQEEEEEPLQMMEEEEEVQMQEEEEEPLQMMEEKEELQMQEEEEEEPLQMMDEEEELQMQAEEEEELIQPKENNSVQKQEKEEEMLQMQEEEEEPLQMQDEEEEELQMQQDRRGAVVDEELSGQIKNAAGKGEPMPESTHERMSDAFGADFSNVKIHRDDAAVQMSRQLGAQAFTHGNDIYFNAGKYNPESNQGKRLLAHELTHVVQQNSDHKTPGVQGFFKKIKRGLKKAGRAIGRGIKSVAGKVAKGTRKVIGATKRGLKSLGKGVRKIGNRVWGSIRKGGKKVWGWMKNTGNKVWGWIRMGGKKVWGWMKKTGSKIWAGLKKAGKWVWNGIKWVGGKLWEKLKGIALRAKRWITSLPARLKRLIVHLWKGVKSLKPWSIEWWKSLGKAETWKNFGLWLGELVIYGLEVMGAGEILETLTDFIKFNTRPMTSTEETEAKRVFGNKINYSLVRIDEYSLIAWLGKKKENADNMGVTTFHTINFSRKIEAQKGTPDMAWLIHELVHVWQYEKMGAMYMARAVHAQSNAGYDYKGIAKLREKQSQGLDGFNLEQQGDIISDYYRILFLDAGLSPKWAKSKNPDISVYQSYVDKI